YRKENKSMFRSLLFSGSDGLRLAANNNPPLRVGSTGDAVRCLQLALVALGHRMPVSVPAGSKRADGIFGPETQQAVIEFQRRNGLVPDGVAGRLTLARLDALLVGSGKDPLENAVTDCRDSAVALMSTDPNNSADLERAELSRTLGELDGLLLGDPRRL